MSIAELRAKLDVLNTTLAPEQALIAEHQKQRRKITRQLGILVYPVLTLPPEIISFPCIVSPAWRQIALVHSSLWAMPYIDFDKTLSRTPSQIENFLESWARRARSRPISLTLHGDMTARLGD
ncbi:hypothetical protein FB451DRAFT_1404548 [Mycena latifolia]|nr:hypothetical protein FB451DRAFT_1404548 [Mycena latifolia]